MEPPVSLIEGVSVRALADHEQESANRFLDAAHARFVGPIDRTVAPRRHPGTDGLGIPLQYFRSAPEALGVLVASPDGKATEWAVAEGPHAGEAARSLLLAGEAWARERGAGEFLILKPEGDPPTEDELFRMGYRAVTPPSLTLRIVNFTLLLRGMASVRQDRLRGAAPLRLHLHLEPGHYPDLPEPDIRIHVDPETTIVDAGVPDPADVRVDTTATAFSEFLFGSRCARAFFGEDVSVSPTERAGVSRTVLEALAIDRPWFTPLGEHR